MMATRFPSTPAPPRREQPIHRVTWRAAIRARLSYRFIKTTRSPPNGRATISRRRSTALEPVPGNRFGVYFRIGRSSSPSPLQPSASFLRAIAGGGLMTSGGTLNEYILGGDAQERRFLGSPSSRHAVAMQFSCESTRNQWRSLRSTPDYRPVPLRGRRTASQDIIIHVQRSAFSVQRSAFSLQRLILYPISPVLPATRATGSPWISDLAVSRRSAAPAPSLELARRRARIQASARMRRDRDGLPPRGAAVERDAIVLFRAGSTVGPWAGLPRLSAGAALLQDRWSRRASSSSRFMLSYARGKVMIAASARPVGNSHNEDFFLHGVQRDNGPPPPFGVMHMGPKRLKHRLIYPA